ncbi:MAG: DUF4080 domain-containing protein [Clostridia bacterium]
MSYTDKIILVAINSKYIHSNTAVYYLYNILANSGRRTELLSFNINENRLDMLRRIFSHNPSVVCFSCYIWNIEIVYSLCIDLRKLAPGVRIILGGPEVSFECEEAMKKSGADLIVRGEGESVICTAVEGVLLGIMPSEPGFFFRDGDGFRDTGYALTRILDDIPSPYDKFMMEREMERLIYYEASRGCPFNCIYCLSSSTDGVRYFSLKRVFDELSVILEYSPKTIKFTDRSFNLDGGRSLEILDFISSLDTDTCFHLEIYPAGLTEKIMEKLVSMPAGRVQLEAGIQSLNIDTLRASGRFQDPERALKNMEILINAGNMHIHLDLIAGLPGEDAGSFAKSFDRTIGTHPHVLQVGFLKLLKGTKARLLDGYVYEERAPYEVLASPSMAFCDVSEIKEIAGCVDMFYNSPCFRSYLKYMHGKYKSPYMLYKDLSGFIKTQQSGQGGISKENQYRLLADFSRGDSMAQETLRYDYFKSFKAKEAPGFLGGISVDKEVVFGFLKNGENVRRYFPAHHGKRPAELYKICGIGRFVLPLGDKTILFIYDEKDRVTERFRSETIET